MATAHKIAVNPENEWRLQTPGSDGWARSVHAGAADKYFIISGDAHLGPPARLFIDMIDEKYRHRMPRMERRDGALWMIAEGTRPTRMIESELEGEDEYRRAAGSSTGTADLTWQLDKRMADLDLDGIDAELVFPNGAALFAFWTADVEFAQAQNRIYNDWAHELTKNHRDRMNVAACIATGDVAQAVREVERVAKLGYRVVLLPNKPIFGPPNAAHLNYNLPEFDPLWAAIQEADMAITFHVSTGTDPRGARGNGGAIINYVIHALAPTIEPVANLCCSGALDRFPKLRFATIEAAASWVPWMINLMDESYKKHHMWVQPYLKHGLPSDYFRAHGAAEFAEDPAAASLIEEYNLQDNLLWGNDYPHHEGTFPHSAQAIERQMGGLSERTRAKVLGLNAARIFKFDIPAKYQHQVTG